MTRAVVGITIPSHALSAAVLSCRSAYVEAAPLSGADAAAYALTDFNRESPICVAPEYPVQEALEDMARLGIHALLVAGAVPGGPRRVLGLVTSQRLQQREPIRRRLPGNSSGPLRVEELMTPWDHLALVNYESLRSLTVSDLHQMFQGTGLTHVLVIEAAEEDSAAVARGLVSRAAVAGRLRQASEAEATS